MATEYLFSNNATTTLASSISATATVINVVSGAGSMFPSPGQGQAFAITLVDAATGLTNEICYCTSRSGDQLTVTRGQEGTNATSWLAGDTCANYITADVMESWLQESDLNGYVTETAGDARYVRNNGGTNGGITRATIDPTTGQPSFLDGDGNWHVVQYYGPYATTDQLAAETTRATTVESNLQTTVGQKVNKSGDTMTGALSIEAFGGVTASWVPTNPSSGSYENYPAFTSSSGGRGGTAFIQLQELVGSNFTAVIGVSSGSGSRFLTIPQGSRANDSAYGNLAYVSDLSNYQPKGNYQPAGNYVDASTISYGTVSGGTYTKIGNVLTQAFTIYVPSNGTNSHRISYPMAFSGSSTATFNLADSGQSRSVSLAENTTPDATGFNISVSVHGNSTAGDDGDLTLTVIAQGIAA